MTCEVSPRHLPPPPPSRLVVSPCTSPSAVTSYFSAQETVHGGDMKSECRPCSAVGFFPTRLSRVRFAGAPLIVEHGVTCLSLLVASPTNHAALKAAVPAVLLALEPNMTVAAGTGDPPFFPCHLSQNPCGFPVSKPRQVGLFVVAVSKPCQEGTPPCHPPAAVSFPPSTCAPRLPRVSPSHTSLVCFPYT